VILAADEDTQDYLWAIHDSMARVSEINLLCWDDGAFQDKYIILYTRKKKGAHLTPGQVPMTQRLFEILSRCFQRRKPDMPWVFWHRYWSSKAGKWCTGPFGDRKKFMKTLRRKVGVRYFRFHALRHSGASLMDGNNVPIGAIQRIPGHENRKTTRIYLHSMGQAEREAIAIFERASKKSRIESHMDRKLEVPGAELNRRHADFQCPYPRLPCHPKSDQTLFKTTIDLGSGQAAPVKCLHFLIRLSGRKLDDPF
jgi:hypothetical protein